MEYVRYCVRESFSMELGSAHIVVFASCHGRAVVPSTYTLAHGLLSTLWRGAKYRTPMFIPRRRARAATPLSFSADRRITPQNRACFVVPHRTSISKPWPSRHHATADSGASGERVCVDVAGEQQQLENPDLEDRRLDASRCGSQVSGVAKLGVP